MMTHALQPPADLSSRRILQDRPLRRNPWSTPFVGVAHSRLIAIEQEGVTAINSQRPAQLLQRPIDGSVDMVDRGIHERCSDGRDQMLECREVTTLIRQGSGGREFAVLMQAFRLFPFSSTARAGSLRISRREPARAMRLGRPQLELKLRECRADLIDSLLELLGQFFETIGRGGLLLGGGGDLFDPGRRLLCSGGDRLNGDNYLIG